MSPYGPVVSDVMEDVKAITPEGMVAILQYTGLRPNDRTVQALSRINMAESADSAPPSAGVTEGQRIS